MGAVSQYIQGLRQRGRHHFTTEEVVTALGGDRNAISRALLRLKNKGEVATPQKGFFVVVPPEYRSLGCLPAEQFVSQLMGAVGEQYHVALLSAAEFHGAAHQRPQRFQVMVRKPRASIECGSVAVDFHVRSDGTCSTCGMRFIGGPPRRRELLPASTATCASRVFG